MSLMMITRRRASALMFGGAALCANPSQVLAQSIATVRIGIQPVEAAAAVYYAKDMGFFTKAGLDADIQPFQNTPAIAAAVASSSIDIGFITVDVLAAIHEKNIPAVAIAPANEYVSPTTTRTNALVLPANSPIEQAKGLNGKIIAIAGLHSLSETAARVWIDQNGGDSSTVKFVEVPFPAMPAALDAGRVDAAWVVEPFVGAATKNGRVLAYGFDGVSKHFINAVWFAAPQWANAHSNVVSRFAAAIRETAIWANENQTKSAGILARYTSIDPGVIAIMARVHFPEQMTPALMQPLIDASAKYQGFSSFPAQELIYVPAR
jgi:NitT/TauT family transport system substrate-binding protein